MGRGSVQNQENDSGVHVGANEVTRKSQELSSRPSKSRIPVPTPPKSSSAVSTEAVKTRRPLGQIQNSPQITKSPVTVTPKKTNKATSLKAEKLIDKKSVDTGCVTDVHSARLSLGVPGTPQNSPTKPKGRKLRIGKNKECADTDIVENEEKSIAYWKELAESRRQALEDALLENYELHQRMEDLQKENSDLEELVKEAKDLATMVNDALEEASMDESGIGDIVDVIKSS